jgi:uncharacterized protein (TIGR00297 family)
MMERALAGLMLAGALALGAWRGRSLSSGGAIAAVAVGTAATVAGWNWAALLIAFFITSTALSRYRRSARDARIGDIVEKGDARDVVQVFANGGVFAAAALAGSITGDPNLAAGAAGALAAATADTWATEIGTLAGRLPRSIVSFQVLEPGTSGGVTVPGTLASAVGAAFIAVAALATGASAHLAPVFLGGLAGSLSDSLAGATVQERRWCERCSRFTERRTHSCGSATRVSGGVRGLRNDVVNLLCTLVGGGVALLMAR